MKIGARGGMMQRPVRKAAVGGFNHCSEPESAAPHRDVRGLAGSRKGTRQRQGPGCGNFDLQALRFAPQQNGRLGRDRFGPHARAISVESIHRPVTARREIELDIGFATSACLIYGGGGRRQDSTDKGFEAAVPPKPVRARPLDAPLGTLARQPDCIEVAVELETQVQRSKRIRTRQNPRIEPEAGRRWNRWMTPQGMSLYSGLHGEPLVGND